MASVGFGSTVAAVAPASSSAAGRSRPRRSVLVLPAATRGSPAPAKEEKSLVDFIFGVIFKKDQLVETDPLLNKVDGAPARGGTTSSRAKTTRGGTTAGGKKAASSDDGGSGLGFNIGGLFDKKG
ncbi:hypothetical protein PAHAL_9G026300 [Panicum hallii]|jgi:hypothetical protein|uniref:Uncharacterized protein n=1 Tax=Panicum hallii TaxID=206008 RepID=A0A2S3IGM9_9POAL|nr:uncharacterized protein LOC112872875 [Panicum hallii]PAN44223.1 hypothetical protein PAHAL_9G026300 [Panicum hallii]